MAMIYTSGTSQFFFLSRNLGDDWYVKPEVIDDIEAFICLMYGQAQEKSINAVRTIMLKQMVGVDDKTDK